MGWPTVNARYLERHRGYYRRRQKEHGEEFRASRRTHYRKNRVKIRAYYHTYYRSSEQKAKNRARGLRDKLAAFSAYGNSCACCGEAEKRFLTMDHIAGRKDGPLGKYEGSKLYSKLRLLGYPKGFRVLCMNCNWAIGVGGHCPHEEVT